MKKLAIIFCCLLQVFTYAQDTAYLKIHFLYGSKPVKKYKDTEQKWFGGILGGHVGIEGDSNKILSFLPKGKFHFISKNENRHSTFTIHSIERFYEIFGGNPDSVKKAVVWIPVTPQQKKKLDSISAEYLRRTPYDYAFAGMRCGAAAYEILGQLDIVTSYGRSKTVRKIFYPRKLRKRLFAMAEKNGWTTARQTGSIKRRWEKD